MVDYRTMIHNHDRIKAGFQRRGVIIFDHGDADRGGEGVRYRVEDGVTPTVPSFPWQFRAARTLADLTINQLAEISGVSGTTIRRIESGEVWRKTRKGALGKIITVLWSAGIEMINAGPAGMGGAGARLLSEKAGYGRDIKGVVTIMQSRDN